MLKCLNDKDRRCGGFTLVELVVVLAIVSIITSMAMVNYKASQQQLAIQRSAAKLASDIRRTQEMTLSAREIPNSTIYGYGMYFNTGNPNQYIIYADKNGDSSYNGGNEDVEIISFESGVELDSLSPSPLSIFFKPPDPITIISGTENKATIKVHLKSDTGIKKTIEVNKVGMVEIQ